MNLYVSGIAAPIRYPEGVTDAQYVAEELAARLDELANGSTGDFAAGVGGGLPASDVEAIYVGLNEDWGVSWWAEGTDFGMRVVSGPDCINPLCTGNELHIIARNNPLLLRAVWLMLDKLGWRHYMPNGVDGLSELWIHKRVSDAISTDIDRVWTGAVDHLLESIAGGTSNLGWSDGSNHGALTNLDGNILYPDGLQEGDLSGAIGSRPLIESAPEGSWLRHMGWTSSSSLQANAAWGLISSYGIDNEPLFGAWDAAAGTGHYTEQFKLYTDSELVQQVALDYANDKVSNRGLDWVSLSRPDGDAEWDIDFGDSTFDDKPPVQRQIELANHVARSPDYTGAGIVIQAYGDCAEAPVNCVWPDGSAVAVVVVEAYRPPGKTIEQIIDDYVDIRTDRRRQYVRVARCPVGLYQYLYSSAWGVGIITAKAGDPERLLESVNRVRYLPQVSPKILTGEAMTAFGLYGLGYYCYMRMVLDIGRAETDFTRSDFARHRKRFMRDMFPTRAVRSSIRNWYDILLDDGHKPLLSAHLVRCLWDELEAAMASTTAGTQEEQRIVELCKYTRYLDLRNRFEATEVAGVNSEADYDLMMEWLFRIRDSGLDDVYSFFQFPLNEDNHAALGLGTIWDALNTPPVAWETTPPSVDDFKNPGTNWIAAGIAENAKHGLTDTVFSTDLVPGGFIESRPRQPSVALQPYRAGGKLRLWLIPRAETFQCLYRVGSGPAYVEFVNQATGEVDEEFTVDSSTDLQIDTRLSVNQHYEIVLTTYSTGDRVWLDWWSAFTQGHYVSYDPGRDGDPCGFQAAESTGERSFYFLVPDGVSEIHFYASIADELQLFVPDGAGGEVEDATFSPASRAYQTHSVAGTGRRVLRIAGIRLNDNGFWLLNCPNLFAHHPDELIRPVDA